MFTAWGNFLVSSQVNYLPVLLDLLFTFVSFNLNLFEKAPNFELSIYTHAG